MKRDATLYRDDLCDYCDHKAVAFGSWFTVNLETGEQTEGEPYQLCRKCDGYSPEALETAISRRDVRLMEEIRKDPAAVERLQERQAQEQMSAFAVLRHFGDPRTWEVRP